MNEVFKHSVKNSADEAISLSVTYSGHEKCSGNQKWGKGIRQQYILHLVISGKGTYITPEGEFSLSEGDIFLIRPYTEIEYYADSCEPWEYYWVNFTGNDAEYILKRTDLTVNSPVMHNCSDEVFAAMKTIVSNPANHRYENIELTGQLYILLALLMKNSVSASVSGREHSRRRILKTAKDYIETNYPMAMSVEDISAAAAVSRTTLFRVFRSELNMTPVEYLISFRIAQAKKLLSETDLSVMAIARSVGYEDNLYFSRAFREIEGKSPTEYRKLQQKSI